MEQLTKYDGLSMAVEKHSTGLGHEDIRVFTFDSVYAKMKVEKAKKIYRALIEESKILNDTTFESAVISDI